MPNQRIPISPMLDLKAVFWAGLISGGMFILVGLGLSTLYFNSPAFVIRLAASIILGPEKLIASQSSLLVLAVGVLVQLVLAEIYTLLIAFIFHRGGILVGLFGGMLMGLALYTINFNNMSLFFPWVLPLRNTVLLITHVVFGGISGFLYELFEDESYDEAYKKGPPLSPASPNSTPLVEEKP